MARSRATRQMMHKKSPEKWIQGSINPANKGALNRELGVPEGKKIPERKLEKAEHSKNLTLRRRANWAENVKKSHH
jgi:hypothetical protein